MGQLIHDRRRSSLPATSIDIWSGISNTAFRGITTWSDSPPPHPKASLAPTGHGGPRGLTTQPNKAVAIAAIDVTLFARTAGPIVYKGLDDDSCSHFDVVHIVANLLYDAANFVTHSQRHFLIGDGMRGRGHEIGTPEVFMEVCIASVSEGSCDGLF